MLLRIGSREFDVSTMALVVAPVDASATAADEARRPKELGADAVELRGEPEARQGFDVPILARDATDGGAKIVTASADSLADIASLAQAGKAVVVDVDDDPGAAGVIVGAVMAGARLIVTSEVRMARRTVTTVHELLRRRGVTSAAYAVLGSNR